MNVLLKWITNGIVIGLAALALPTVSFSSLLFPALALIAVAILVSAFTPNMIDTEKEMLPLHFFFTDFFMNIPIFLIAVGATPGITITSGFITVIIFAVLAALSNSFIQIHFKKEKQDDGQDTKLSGN